MKRVLGLALGLVVGAMAGKARLAGTNRPGCAGFDTTGTKRAFELADSTRLAPTVPLKGRKHARMGAQPSKGKQKDPHPIADAGLSELLSKSD